MQAQPHRGAVTQRGRGRGPGRVFLPALGPGIQDQLLILEGEEQGVQDGGAVAGP